MLDKFTISTLVIPLFIGSISSCLSLCPNLFLVVWGLLCHVLVLDILLAIAYAIPWVIWGCLDPCYLSVLWSCYYCWWFFFWHILLPSHSSSTIDAFALWYQFHWLVLVSRSLSLVIISPNCNFFLKLWCWCCYLLKSNSMVPYSMMLIFVRAATIVFLGVKI